MKPDCIYSACSTLLTPLVHVPEATLLSNGGLPPRRAADLAARMPANGSKPSSKLGQRSSASVPITHSVTATRNRSQAESDDAP